jgi:hypothetical protein
MSRRDVDARYLEPQNIDGCFDVIRDHFNTINTPVTEIQYWENAVVIVLEHNNTDLTTVPSSIAKCRCFYLFEEEMKRPGRGAREPSKDTVDNTPDERLRPGIMLGAGTPSPTDPDI